MSPFRVLVTFAIAAFCSVSFAKDIIIENNSNQDVFVSLAYMRLKGGYALIHNGWIRIVPGQIHKESREGWTDVLVRAHNKEGKVFGKGPSYTLWSHSEAFTLQYVPRQWDETKHGQMMPPGNACLLEVAKINGSEKLHTPFVWDNLAKQDAFLTGLGFRPQDGFYRHHTDGDTPINIRLN